MDNIMCALAGMLVERAILPSQPTQMVVDTLGFAIVVFNALATKTLLPFLTERIVVVSNCGLWDVVDGAVASLEGDLATATAASYTVERLWTVRRYHQSNQLCMAHQNSLQRASIFYSSMYMEA